MRYFFIVNCSKRNLSNFPYKLSIDTYLHLAKSELANMPEILRKLDEQRKEDAIDSQERYLFNELKRGYISTEEYINKIEQLKNN